LVTIAPGIAIRGHLGVGLFGVDLLRALLGIGFGEQPVDRNIDKFRISIIMLAIGIDQLKGFDKQMKILGAIMCHGSQVNAFQQIQHLGQDRALTPWTAGIHLIAMESCGHGLFDLHPKFGQILARQ
jgi:hypothetical protein